MLSSLKHCRVATEFDVRQLLHLGLLLDHLQNPVLRFRRKPCVNLQRSWSNWLYTVHFLGFSVSGCCPTRADGVDGGFYLWAGSQGKACRHNIRDVVATWKRVFMVFFLTQEFAGEPKFRPLWNKKPYSSITLPYSKIRYPYWRILVLCAFL